MAEANKLQVSLATWIFCLLLIVVGLSAWWFFSNFTREPFTQDRGYSEEARRDPFLAAKLFLQAKDIEFESRENFSLFEETIGAFDTVFINSSRVGMSKSLREKMKAWVNDGGHLVILATEPFEQKFDSSRDEFLDELGLRFYEEGYSPDDEAETIASLNFEGYDEATQVSFGIDGYIEDVSGEASFVAGTDYAEQLIQYQLGEGLVTVTMDFDVWNNERIEEFDHAIFLTQLVGFSDKVWMVFNRLQPSLLQMAFRSMPLVVISIAVFLFVLLFSRLWRKGAVHQDESLANRQIMQHIGAAAEFNYRTDQGQSLIDDLLRQLNQRMAQVSHGYARQSPEKQLHKLSQHTGISVKQLEPLLDSHNETHDVFLSKVKLVQQIRKHL